MSYSGDFGDLSADDRRLLASFSEEDEREAEERRLLERRPAPPRWSSQLLYRQVCSIIAFCVALHLLLLGALWIAANAGPRPRRR
ncbi:hypothetical protein MRX96_035044 [Rhipicephalus microplus]